MDKLADAPNCSTWTHQDNPSGQCVIIVVLPVSEAREHQEERASSDFFHRHIRTSLKVPESYRILSPGPCPKIPSGTFAPE